MYVGRDFDVLDPGETDIFAFDFANENLAVGETLSTAAFTCEVVEGTDSAPQSRVIGSATISGTKASQKVGTALAGVIYRLTATVTTSASRTLKLYSHFACQTPQ